MDHKNSKLTPEELKMIKEAVASIVGDEFASITITTDEEEKPQTRELLADARALSKEIWKLRKKAEDLTFNTLKRSFESGDTRVIYGCAFAARTMLECLQQVIEQTANFVERTADDD